MDIRYCLKNSYKLSKLLRDIPNEYSHRIMKPFMDEDNYVVSIMLNSEKFAPTCAMAIFFDKKDLPYDTFVNTYMSCLNRSKYDALDKYKSTCELFVFDKANHTKALKKFGISNNLLSRAFIGYIREEA